jgi:hypothetical protein
MIDEYQFVLEPALQSVKDLRSAYRGDVQRDREECDNRLRVALAKIERREVRHCVDGYLAGLGGPITLDRRWRSELLEKEAELSALVGRGGDRKIIKRALDDMLIEPSKAWVTSTTGLAAFLRVQHERMCADLRPTSLLGWRDRRHNRRVLARADRAAFAVGIVLADVLEKAYLRVSYGIGGAIAKECGP